MAMVDHTVCHVEGLVVWTAVLCCAVRHIRIYLHGTFVWDNMCCTSAVICFASLQSVDAVMWGQCLVCVIHPLGSVTVDLLSVGVTAVGVSLTTMATQVVRGVHLVCAMRRDQLAASAGQTLVSAPANP